MNVKVELAGALALLAAKAVDFDGLVIGQGANELDLEVIVTMPDGQTTTYWITARAQGAIVSARETKKLHLPAFCPDRHINGDGTFCLGWSEINAVEVLDANGAWRWWATLIKFLRLQQRAVKKRRWPDKKAWAHGDAARHQLQAERSAMRLSAAHAADFLAGRITIERRIGQSAIGPALRIARGGRWESSVWEKSKRPVSLRRRCICPAGAGARPTTLRSCEDGEHAKAAAELAFAIRDMEAAERSFWKSLEGKPCCGTIDGCPLAVTTLAV